MKGRIDMANDKDLEREARAAEKAAAKKKEDEGPRSFAVFLQQIDEGALHDELSETTQQVTKELTDYALRFQRKAKGTITVTLALTVSGNGTVSVVPEVKTKTPKRPHAESIFFVTPGNNLTLEHQRQQMLPLREVTDLKHALRDLPADVKVSVHLPTDDRPLRPC